MRYAIFSDIQGNYRALEKFFREIERKVDSFLCLGDIVQQGVSFEDNRCIGLLRDNDVIAVQGNHEEDVLGNIEEARKKISHLNLEYLAELPKTLIINGKYYLVHAPSGRRISTVEQAEEEFPKLPEGIATCFFGHSHQPAIYSKSRRRVSQEGIRNGRVGLIPDKKYMINPGGLGLYWGMSQTYILFDEETGILQLKKLEM